MVFLGVIFCFLTGCEVKPQKTGTYQGSLEVDYSSDMQIMYLCSGGSTSVPITKSDTGYYYIGEDKILIYIDKESTFVKNTDKRYSAYMTQSIIDSRIIILLL